MNQAFIDLTFLDVEMYLILYNSMEGIRDLLAPLMNPISITKIDHLAELIEMINPIKQCPDRSYNELSYLSKTQLFKINKLKSS